MQPITNSSQSKESTHADNTSTFSDPQTPITPSDDTLIESDTYEETPLLRRTKQARTQSSWSQWQEAFKSILPIFIATRLAFLLLTYVAALFTVGNFSTQTLRLYTMVHAWYRWDSGHFTSIATKGYDLPYRTAFFPLFPLLESGLAFLTHDAFVAGLIISNLACLGMFTVLYRLVVEDFDGERAYRTVLYLAVFPTAFFFAAAYNESLFLCFALFSFYQMRHGYWWLAGLLGFLASLTRSTGLFLFLPFLYEYLRQHNFKLSNIRLDILSSIAIPGGLGVFALYCYLRFHDPLAFSHAQNTWHHQLHFPWYGMLGSLRIVTHQGILNFYSIHNMIDLNAGLLMLILLVLCFIGPWKFSRDLWIYSIYAVPLYIFLLLFPANDALPLVSLSRYVLELFPAFIVLAGIGKKQQFNLYYLTLSVTMLSFMLLQFLTGHWIV